MRTYRVLIAMALIFGTSGSAHAQNAPFALPALSQSELAKQVGGLRTPNGLEIGFGATVQTYVDGQLALRTQLTWTNLGVNQTTDVATPGSDITSAAAISGIHIVGEAAVGVLVPGSNGGTAIIHDLDNDRIGSLVLNTADNRDVRQDTMITLDIPNLQQFQGDVAAQQLALRLQDSVGRALGETVH